MRFRPLLTISLLLPATRAFAACGIALNDGTLTVNTSPDCATKYSLWVIVGKIIAYLTGAIGAVAIAMFVLGALFVTLSGIKEEWRQKGKDLMMGSILSAAVVLGAYAILRMLEYFLTR